jgi:hypothetical protein
MFMAFGLIRQRPIMTHDQWTDIGSGLANAQPGAGTWAPFVSCFVLI